MYPRELSASLWTNEGTPDIYYVADNHRVFYDRWALNQLFQRYRIPILFYDRCKAKLKNDIFTEHITDRNARTKLLLRYKNSEHPRTIRAVVTTKYGILDDHELFPTVMDQLEEQQAQLQSFHFDSHITQLYADWPDCEVEWGGTRYHAGVLITNSETARSSIWIEPTVISPHCSYVNRAALRRQRVGLRLIHRGDVDVERVIPMIQEAKRIAQVGIVQLMEAWEERVSGPEALEIIHDMDTLPGRIQDILDEEWENEEILRKAYVAQRIMELARTLPLFQRITVEQEASAITGIFDNYEQRIQEMMSDG
jgi:hypothetical protein